MILRLKVIQVISLGQNMVRLILTRPGLRSRVEPIPKSEEQKMMQDLTKQVTNAFGGLIPGGVVVGGSPFSQGDAKIDMQISSEEYEQLGRPGINETVQLELNKIKNE